MRGAFWASLENWGRQSISLIVFMVLARIVAPADIGLYAIVAIVITLMQVFLDTGVGDAIVQRSEIDAEHLDAGFWSNMALSVALALAAAVLAGPIAALFGEPDLRRLLPVASLIIVLGSLSTVQQALLKRNLDFKPLAIRTLSSILVAGALGIWMARTGHGVWALIAQQITEKAIGTIQLWWRSDWRPRLAFSRPHARDLLPYSANMIGTRALVFLQKQFDRFFVGLLLGPVALGLYTLAGRILDSFSSILFDGVAMASVSTFARLQGEADRLREAVFLVCRFSSLIGFPCFVGLALVAPDLIRAVFGAKWDGTAEVLRVLALTGIPWLFATMAAVVTRASGHMKWFLSMMSAMVALKVILLLTFTRLGLYPLIVAFTLGDFAMIPLYVWITRSMVPMRALDYLRCFGDAVLACAVMAAAVLAVQVNLPPEMASWLRCLLPAVAGALAYAGCVLLVARPTLKRFSALLAIRKGSAAPQ
ncbi:lipopolysaccharide biosynthesis protein [soil metagenome]